jgi:hypothetical protein
MVLGVVARAIDREGRMNTVILDRDGAPQSGEWLREIFGPVAIYRSEGQLAYRVVELRDEEGVAAMTVTVLDELGEPCPRLTVVYRRKDGTADRKLQTDVNGQVRFALGGDARYSPPEEGPYVVLIRRKEAPSDAVLGMGMVRQANKRHLNVAYRWGEGPGAPEPPAPPEPPEPPPPPEPPEPPEPPVPPEPPPPPEPPAPPEPPEPPGPAGDTWAQLLARLDRIVDLLEKRSG